LERGKLLIADDELHLIRSLKFVLEKEGYEVATASDGEEAIRKAAEIRPDVMFLDIMMPKKNGYEVCAILRQVPGLKDMYIVILSAKGWDIDRDKALLAGADEFMSKPFSPLELVTRVNNIIDSRALAESGIFSAAHK